MKITFIYIQFNNWPFDQTKNFWKFSMCISLRTIGRNFSRKLFHSLAECFFAVFSINIPSINICSFRNFTMHNFLFGRVNYIRSARCAKRRKHAKNFENVNFQPFCKGCSRISRETVRKYLQTTRPIS